MYLVDVASLNLYDLYEYKFIMICEDVKMLCVCVCVCVCVYCDVFRAKLLCKI